MERQKFIIILIKGKGKVFYGQEPPSGESTTTECGVNYQLLAVITEVAQWGTPSCSRPQSATDNGVRDGRSVLRIYILPIYLYIITHCVLNVTYSFKY